MNIQDSKHSGRAALRTKILRGLFFYALIPALLLVLLAGPVGNTVRGSDAAVFLVLLGALVAVGLNWFVYHAVRGKVPSLLVFSFGALCVLAVAAIELESLPGDHPLRSTLAVIGGFLALSSMLLLSFWCARHRSKAAHAAAVVIWVLLGLVFCGMAYSAIRDFETGNITLDTWIAVFSMIALALGCCAPRFLSSRRRSLSRRRKTGQAEGRIVQVIGETRLDRDDDLVTRDLARIQYSADDVLYEIKAQSPRHIVRRFGKKAFTGQSIPVFYDPADPGDAFVNKIDRHFFDPPQP